MECVELSFNRLGAPLRPDLSATRPLLFLSLPPFTNLLSAHRYREHRYNG